MVQTENRYILLYPQLSLEFCRTKAHLGRCDEGNGNHSCFGWQIATFHHCSALDAGSEFTAGARKRLLVFKPVVFGTATAFAVDTFLNSLVFDERNASRFVREPIVEIEDIHGQNRLFRPN